MKNYILIAILLGGICLGFPIGHGCKKCQPCPEIIPGQIVVLDTVIVHDTIVRWYPSKKIVKTVEVDSSTDREYNCYTVEDHPQGVYVKATICSKEFPEQKPEDVYSVITIQKPNDTVHTLLRIDTVTMPPLPNKKWYIGVGPYSGFGINQFGKPSVQAGIGIHFGRRLYEVY